MAKPYTFAREQRKAWRRRKNYVCVHTKIEFFIINKKSGKKKNRSGDEKSFRKSFFS